MTDDTAFSALGPTAARPDTRREHAAAIQACQEPQIVADLNWNGRPSGKCWLDGTEAHVSTIWNCQNPSKAPMASCHPVVPVNLNQLSTEVDSDAKCNARNGLANAEKVRFGPNFPEIERLGTRGGLENSNSSNAMGFCISRRNSRETRRWFIWKRWIKVTACWQRKRRFHWGVN
jgi:hypothetical protein